MDFPTFLSHLVWPIVVLIIFFALRTELAKLLGRLTKFEGPGGVKGEFEKELKEAQKEAKVEDLPSVPVPTTTTTTTTTTTPDPNALPQDDWPKLIEADPASAVAKAWRRTEEAILLRFPMMTSEPTPRRGFAFRQAVERVPSHLRDLLDRLRRMRNQAVHGGYDAITPLQAEEYIQLSHRFIAALQEDAP